MDRYGKNTFEWPALHEVRQKPLDPFDMDSFLDKNFLGRGAHMTLAVFIKNPGGETRSPQAIQRRYYKRAQAKAGRNKAEGQQGSRGKGPAAVAAAHSPGTFANQELGNWNGWNENPSAVAEESSSTSWDLSTHHSWQTGAKDSSAVPVWQSNSTSHSHPGQGWHEGGWKGGGESNETYYADRWEVYAVQSSEDDGDWEEDADPWEQVMDVPDPEWCYDNHIDNIEYNRTTGEYKFTTLDPWHKWYAWTHDKLGMHLNIYR